MFLRIAASDLLDFAQMSNSVSWTKLLILEF